MSPPYNTAVHSWVHAFHKLLESLRCVPFASQPALELLQECIYYAYSFYLGLVKDPRMNAFRSGWLSALGDLVCYHIAATAMLDGNMGSSGSLTVSALQATTDMNKATGLKVPPGTANGNSTGKKSVSDLFAGRLESQPPSVGIAAA